MGAGEEIDLTGLEKQIKDVQNDIQKLGRSFDIASKDIQRFGDLSEKTNVNVFKNDLQSTGKILENFRKQLGSGNAEAVKSFQTLIEQLRTLKGTASELGMTNVIEQLNKIQNASSQAGSIAATFLNSLKQSSVFAQQTATAQQQTAQSTSQAANATQRQAQAQQQVANAAKQTATATTRQLNTQKLHVGSITAAMQRTQQLIMQGNTQMISSYLKQEKSIKRINNALAGLRAAQEQCNLATKEGQQQYARLGQQIKSLEFMLGRNANIADRLSSAFSKSKSMVEQLAMSFGVMTGVFGATNFVKQLYKITAEFQLQQRALGAIIQNTREANVLFKQMQSLAVESPMKFMDLNRYAKQLAAFRIETTNLYDSLKMLGDIAVGVGVDMDRLILAYGQVKAANYLRGQELRQFSEAGVNILGGLQEYYRDTKNINMSINEIFDSVSKRKVLFEDVDAVLKRMTQSGGEFYNMQLIQSQTLYGQLQKLGDLFQISMNNIGNSTSGVLMKIITSIQFLIRHLREVVSVLVAMAGAAALNKLIRNFASLRAGAQSLAISLREGWQVARALGATRLTAFTTALWNANAGMVALNAAISIGLVAFSLWMAKHQEQKARQEEIERTLIEEITEYNRRLSEVRGLEKAYEKDPSFEGRLALLQQLIEKAKEYRLALKIDENLTPANINKNFEDAKNQLEAYTKQVLLFKSVLYTTDVKDALDSLNSVNIEFANATLSAEKMINALSNVYDSLSDKQKKALDEIRDIDEAFLKNDEEFLKGVDYTYDQWQIKRIEKLNELSATAKTSTGDISRWFGGAKIEVLDEAQQKQFDSIISDLRDFGQKYNKEIQKTTEALKPKVEKIISADDFAKLDEKEIKEKIADNASAILDALNEAGEFAKQNMPLILQKIWDLDNEKSVSVAKVLVEIEEAETNAKNTRLQRFIDDVAKSDENGFVKTLSYEVEIKQTGDTPAFVGTAEQAEQQGIINQKKKEELETTMQIVTAVQKTVGGEKEKKKVFDDEYKMYKEQLKMIQRAYAYGLDEKKVLEGINSQLGTSFATLTGAQSVIETILKNGETLAKWLSWEIPETKTNHGRTQSMKSEYQSMIDFVRELNREFDTLRKNFNEKDSARWAGATNRILSSFEAKFGAMPAKFKKAFQDSLASIDFTTKEGTVNAENIVKGLIDSAKDLTNKEKEELQRAWGEAVGQIKLEAELELKAREDERLKAQVQKMFDDYNLTIELDKLGVDADEVGKLFNIDTKDLLTLENKLESMKEEFVGRNMEKEYRQFMRKIVEINDKANLEMAKKYVKYLREEYGERAKVELEYMRQRAEIYALPFDENETMRILDNLQKETNEKLSKLKWEDFKSTDFYVEMFENLERVSTKSLQTMIDKLNEYKDTLKDMPAADFKAITEQLNKVSDELVKRNPFKMLVDSLKQIKNAKSIGSDTGDAVRKMLGLAGDADIKQFSKSLNDALNKARLKLIEFRNKLEEQGVLLGAAKDRDLAKKYFEQLPQYANIELYDEDKVSEQLDKLKERYKTLTEDVNKELAKGQGVEEPTEKMLEKAAVKEQIDMLTKLREAYIKLGRDRYRTQTDIEKDITKTKGVVKEYKEDVDAMENTSDQLKKASLAIKQLSEDWVDAMGKVKTSFDTVFDSLDYLGGSTDQVSEAWKDLGDTIFDTVTRAISLVGEFAAAAVAGETAINAASGWIGIIAEAITLLVTGIAQIFKLKDAKIEREIEKLQKSLDKLEKTAEDLSEAFESSYAEEELRQLDAALIRTRELAIATLEDMKEAEEAKKKSDQAAIDDYQNQIDSLNKEMQEGIENFYEALGGFGSAANMKSTVEEWTDAWYEAFKETGDGLSGLEDSFEEFFENIVKKTLMNNIMAKYFGEDFLASLDTILGTEGGVMGNLDALNDWITQYHDLAVQADEEMQAATQAIQNVTGIGGGLEGLQAGLQGMTEETADILAAYLNSVRFYVADNNQLLQNLLNGLTIDNNSNPMLQQLKIVAAQTTSINLLLDSVVHSGGYQGNGGGSYLKVHAILES